MGWLELEWAQLELFTSAGLVWNWSQRRVKSDIVYKENGQGKIHNVVCIVQLIWSQFDNNNWHSLWFYYFSVRSGCNRPPPVANGFYTSRGIVNQVYPTGTTVKYHCDSEYQLIGASVFTCIRRDWMPKDLPTCKPIVKADQNGESDLHFFFFCICSSHADEVYCLLLMPKLRCKPSSENNLSKFSE